MKAWVAADAREGGLIGVGALSALWLTQMLWALRRPRGLLVSSWGLRGVRGAPSVLLPWDYWRRAVAVASPNGARLVLQLESGGSVTIHGQYLGSDPNLVAAIIEHFRTHADDGDRLANAHDAIRCVEEAQQPRG